MFSPYLRSRMLSAVFTPDAYAAELVDQFSGDPLQDSLLPVGTLLVALTTQVPHVDDGPGALVEPVGGNYCRQLYLARSTHWAETGFGELFNTDSILFPVVTAEWGRVCGWALIDPRANQVLAADALLNPFITTVGMVPTIDAGTITLGIYSTYG